MVGSSNRRRFADRMVVVVSIVGAVFVAGLEVGDHQSRARLARTCVAQPGERLISTHQTAAGVECLYATDVGYATAKRRPAVNS